MTTAWNCTTPANTRLSSQCFDISYGFGDSEQPVTTAPFGLTVPFPPSAKQIVLKQGRRHRRHAAGQQQQAGGECRARDRRRHQDDNLDGERPGRRHPKLLRALQQ